MGAGDDQPGVLERSAEDGEVVARRHLIVSSWDSHQNDSPSPAASAKPTERGR